MTRTPLRPGLLLPLLALVPVLTGCKLIDQRTFDANAGKPVVIPAPPGPPNPQALITVDFARPNPDYQAQLQQAVESALARKPNVLFDVVTVVPATGTPAQQVAAATALTADARAIARAINADGVDDDHIDLQARAEPGQTTRQVQVFVH